MDISNISNDAQVVATVANVVAAVSSNPPAENSVPVDVATVANVVAAVSSNPPAENSVPVDAEKITNLVNAHNEFKPVGNALQASSNIPLLDKLLAAIEEVVALFHHK